MSRKKRMNVVEFASITHQGKVLKMLGEVGVVWRPKTRPKNNLRLNMNVIPLDYVLVYYYYYYYYYYYLLTHYA